MQNRGIPYLKSIVKYCKKIEDIHAEYGNSYERYYSSTGYQCAISFCVEQIGELAVKLRNEGYTKNYTSVEWHQIAGLRNKIAHGYDSVDLDMVYKISLKDVPELLQSCQEILQKKNGFEQKLQDAKQRAGTVQTKTPAKENER